MSEKKKPKREYWLLCEECGEGLVSCYNARDLPSLSKEEWKKHLETDHK